MDITYKDLIAPAFYGLWNDVVLQKYPEIWCAGGRGCVDADTLIETPSGKVRIADFKGGKVYSYDEDSGKIVVAEASKPFKCTYEDLYVVMTEGKDFRRIVVTDEHKFLTPEGWRMTKGIRKGDLIAIATPQEKGLSWAKVDEIRFLKSDYYWDMHVWGTQNYLAEGFVNHNSTKSSAISTFIILLMEMYKNVHCVCFRKYAANLADSVYAQFEFTINQKLKPIANHWLFKKSPLKIVNVNTNQQILFRGLDDPQKVKSLKAPFGYFGLQWFEELAEFDCMEEVRNVNQSLRRGGHYFQTFCSYNPPETTSNWVNAEANTPQLIDGKLYRYVHRSDYRTVPRQWLGDNFFVEAELLKQNNFRAYQHEYLGMVTGNGGAVFPNAEAMTMSDAMIAQFDRRKFGIDWGFALDPAAWVAIHYDKTRRTIYIYDEIYETGMTNLDFASRLKKKDMGFSYVMCDSAEPKSIAEIESLGINALGAQKGPDSVRFSTKWLSSLFHIYIDPIRCPNCWREFSQYEYEKNVAGQFISRYPDKNNHGIDATRYALMEDIISSGLF